MEHIRLIKFFDKVNNNIIERLHGSYRERTKIMRGFDTFQFAKKILDLWTFYYNFIRPHQSIKTTPIEAAGILLPFNEENKWLELIRLSTTPNGGSSGNKRKIDG